jgi:hypothetical protein
MGFARQFVVIWILVAMTLLVQSAGLAVLIHWARASIARGMHGLTPWRTSVLMIRFTVAMIVLTIVEIVLWAVFYRWQCFPTWEPSFYFSAASYSTVGYGDVVLPNVWRTLGPIESVTGVLMSGISVSGLFAILTRLLADHPDSSIPKPDALQSQSQARLVNRATTSA